MVQFREAGATNLLLLHTLDRAVADTASFVEPLRRARGVFIYGGDNNYLADAYVGTLTQREIAGVAGRGGVVAGTSAGAELQGSFMPRGDNADVIIGKRTVGLNLLRGVAVDAHVLVRNRPFDMLEVVKQHPDLLGIGLDEQTAIVVQQDQFEVIGRTYVLLYDTQRAIPPDGAFYFLRPGDRYNLRTREATRPTTVQQPIDRVHRKSQRQ